MIKLELETRIAYTENQILNAEKDLRKIQDRIQNLNGELQGYKNVLQDIEKTEAMKPKESEGSK